MRLFLEILKQHHIAGTSNGGGQLCVLTWVARLFKMDIETHDRGAGLAEIFDEPRVQMTWPLTRFVRQAEPARGTFVERNNDHLGGRRARTAQQKQRIQSEIFLKLQSKRRDTQQGTGNTCHQTQNRSGWNPRSLHAVYTRGGQQRTWPGAGTRACALRG